MKTYHNIQIPGATREEVLEGLDHFFFHKYYTRRDKPVEGASWNLLVSDPKDGWISVYDQGENFRRANQIARTLSAFLHRPVLWLGLFEDFDFYYQLFDDGEAIDAYDSDASIFDPDEGFTDEPEGTGWLPADFSGVNKDRNVAGLGNPTAFFTVFGGAEVSRITKMQSLLSRGRAYHGEGRPDFEELNWSEEGVRQLAEVLGVPADRATTSYDELTQETKPPAWVQAVEYRKIARPAGARRGREEAQ